MTTAFPDAFEVQGKGCFCYDADMVCRIFSKAFFYAAQHRIEF